MAEYPALDLAYPQDEDTPALLELLYACLDDFEPVAIHEHETGDGVRVFFRAAQGRDAAAAALRTHFGERLTSVSTTDVPDDGWARRSQAQLTAVRVGRIVVAPPWAPEANRESDDLLVVIEPSMGFGTGHHATTRLCLELLQREPVRERRVTDVGTGSGVLAIGAWKLGASAVTAVDCDPDALQNARDNVRRNGAEGAITLRESDLSALELPPADVVIANLTGAVLQRYAAALAGLTAPAGRLIVSGFPPEEQPDIERAFASAPAATAVDGAWAAAAFVITSPPTPT